MLCRWLAQFQGQIIHRAGGQVRVLHIDIGHLAVVPGHLQAGAPQEALHLYEYETFDDVIRLWRTLFH